MVIYINCLYIGGKRVSLSLAFIRVVYAQEMSSYTFDSHHLVNLTLMQGGRCGIYGANCPEWIMSMQVCKNSVSAGCLCFLLFIFSVVTFAIKQIYIYREIYVCIFKLFYYFCYSTNKHTGELLI